jgi:hypothetical protein
MKMECRTGNIPNLFETEAGRAHAFVRDSEMLLPVVGFCILGRFLSGRHQPEC